MHGAKRLNPASTCSGRNGTLWFGCADKDTHKLDTQPLASSFTIDAVINLITDSADLIEIQTQT